MVPVVPTRMDLGGKCTKWSQQQRKKIADDVLWGQNWKKRNTEEVIYNIKRDSKIKHNSKGNCQVHIRRFYYTEICICNRSSRRIIFVHIYKKSVSIIDIPQGPGFQHREFYSTLFNSFYGKRIDKKNRYAVCVCVCVCVLTESADCTLRITKLQIDYNIALVWD